MKWDHRPMGPEEHCAHHLDLHSFLDEIVADWISGDNVAPYSASIRRPVGPLLDWAESQARTTSTARRMTPDEHRQRHEMLRDALEELCDCWQHSVAGPPVRERLILSLLRWSCQQCQAATLPAKQGRVQ
jgi:hypothetical protein